MKEQKTNLYVLGITFNKTFLKYIKDVGITFNNLVAEFNELTQNLENFRFTDNSAIADVDMENFGRWDLASRPLSKEVINKGKKIVENNFDDLIIAEAYKLPEDIYERLAELRDREEREARRRRNRR